MFERMTYLHKMIFHLFEKIRNKNSGDWLTLEETGLMDILGDENAAKD